MDQEQDQDPESDYSGAAEIARSMAPRQGGGERPDMAEYNRSLGFGTFAHIEPTEAYIQAVKNQQAAAAKQNAIHPDAQFYASVGDLSGAIAIQKSRGVALFTMGEEYSFGRDNKARRYVIEPHGKMDAMDSKGQRVRINVADYARDPKMNVKTVPFRGGDKKAEIFRGMLTRADSLFKALDDLEDSYAANTGYIGILAPSGTAANAKRLETSVLMDTMAILTGTQTLGGNTSDVDMDIIKSLVPQAASNLIMGMKGNEKYKLAQLRTHVLERLMSAAQANGVTFREVNSGQTDYRRTPNVSGISSGR